MSDSYENRQDHLPPELAAAAGEFVAWSQEQLLAEQDETTPEEPLYHYTGEAALKGILSNERIWCFSHLHQRDQTEFAYSLAIARRIIKEIGRSEDFFTHHFCGCLDDLLQNNSLTDTFEFYMFSLSRHSDDACQWMEYGHAGRGFSIGFAPALFLPDETDLKEQANENLHVGRVIYGDEATARRHRRVIERATEITSRYANAHPDAVRRVRPVPYLRSIVDEVIASQLIWNCLTAKSLCYADEREVRYVLLNLRGKFDPHRKLFDGKAYIEVKLPLRQPGSLVEILLGPCALEGAEEKLAEFLEAHGYPAIPMRRSSAVLESAGCGS
jgi:hypothetical protein